MRYFAQTPNATAEFFRGLAYIAATAVVFELLLGVAHYGPEFFTAVFHAYTAAPAWIDHMLHTTFALGANGGTRGAWGTAR